MKSYPFASFAGIALVAQTYVAQAFRPATDVEDEYARIELLAPKTNSFRMTYDHVFVKGSRRQMKTLRTNAVSERVGGAGGAKPPG